MGACMEARSVHVRAAVMRWNSPGQWIISRRGTHPALITEAEFIAVQETRARRVMCTY